MKIPFWLWFPYYVIGAGASISLGILIARSILAREKERKNDKVGN